MLKKRVLCFDPARITQHLTSNPTPGLEVCALKEYISNAL